MTDDDMDKLVRDRGIADGRIAGSWVIDGNTDDATCRRVLCGLDDGDPAILDLLPTLELGQWADDPTFEEILRDVGLDCVVDADVNDIEDDLWCVYCDAWSEGMVNEVERACRTRLDPGGES